MTEAPSDRKARVAIVTGGGRGIGRAVALELGRAGARVAVVFRADAQSADETVLAIGAAGGEAFAWQADVTAPDQVLAATEAVRARWGRVDVLVNNAGVAQPATALDLSVELWNATLAGNLTGAFLCTQAVLPLMLDQGYGRIVNVSSQAGRSGGRTGPHYAAAKGGLIALTRSLAIAHARDGITVNAVAPNYTETDLLKVLGVNARRTEILEAIPMGRLARPEEVASVIAFLCSEHASYVTGECVGVTGGV
ncbi:MAG TPA: SDR family oxidoreductase [Solirubrobacteraceae bacterium]